MDLPNTKELQKIVNFCRKNGVLSLKNGDFELNLSSAALFPETNYQKRKAQSEKPTDYVPVEGSYTEEDLLDWSSAGVSTGGSN